MRYRPLLLPSFFLGLIMCAACAPRPVIYKDAGYMERGGKAAAQSDVSHCRAAAKEEVGKLNLKPVAERTGWGAATGAAMGAVTGLILGDVRRAVASGAAIGGAGGAAHGAYEASRPDQVERAYAELCLREKGWTVLGWR